MCVTLTESLILSLRNLRDTLDTYEIEEAALSNSTFVCGTCASPLNHTKIVFVTKHAAQGLVRIDY